MARFQRWFLVFTGTWVVLLAIGGWWVLASYNANLVGIPDPAPSWTSYPRDSSTWQLGFGGLLVGYAALGALLDVMVRLALVVTWAVLRRRNRRIGIA